MDRPQNRKLRQAVNLAALCGAVLVASSIPALAGSKGHDGGKRSSESGSDRVRPMQESAAQTNQRSENQGSERSGESDRASGGQGSEKRDDTSNGGEKGRAEGGSSGDRGSDKTSEKNSDKTATGRKSGQGSDDEHSPPGTVAEWLQGIFQPQAPVASVPSIPVAPPAPTKVAPSSPATVAKPQPKALASPAGHVARLDTPALTIGGRPEMLASDLPKKSIDRAVALGFSLNGTARVSSAGLAVTRLVAPPGMTAAQAQDTLQLAFPDQNVEINQKYRIYRTATGIEPSAQPSTARPPKPMVTPCGTDRCFGSAVIHWKPKLQECARTTRIGVVDTGYDAGHPAFINRAIQRNRHAAKGHERSPDWHGTGVLALLAGDTKSGTPGLVPDASFFLADIFYADTDGAPASDTASLLQALDWLDEKKVAIINLSLTGPPDELLKKAIAGLSSKGVIFIAAVGNDGPSAPPSYPAAYGPVIAVTAVTSELKSYRYASRGEHVDVAAPGVDIWTALPNGQAGYHSGTSFAVPYVTAVVAAVYGDMAKKTKEEFWKRVSIVDLGEPGPDPVYGRGLLLAPASCGHSVAVSAIRAPASGAGLAARAPTR
jgi:hypothetical protein